VAVNINAISINTDPSGFDSLFDYADMLRELAEEVDAFRNTYRDQLKEQRDQLREYADRISEDASRLAVNVAIGVLTTLQPQLEQIRSETRKLDDFLTDVKNAQAIISGLATTIGLLGNILSIIGV
jgi:DNA anti-recombination protein RmuC